METREDFDPVVKYKKMKEEVMNARNDLIEKQEKLKKEVKAAGEVFGSNGRLIGQIEELDKKINAISNMLNEIEQTQLENFNEFVNRNRANMMLARVLDSEKRTDSEKREKQAIAARSNKEIEMKNEKRSEIRNTTKFKIALLEAGGDIKKEEEAYKKMDDQVKEYIAEQKNQDKLDKVARKVQKKGALSFVEKGAAKSKLNEYLKTVPEEDKTEYKNLDKELRSATKAVSQHCNNCVEAHYAIKKSFDTGIQTNLHTARAHLHTARKGEHQELKRAHTQTIFFEAAKPMPTKNNEDNELKGPTIGNRRGNNKE